MPPARFCAARTTTSSTPSSPPTPSSRRSPPKKSSAASAPRRSAMASACACARRRAAVPTDFSPPSSAAASDLLELGADAEGGEDGQAGEGGALRVIEAMDRLLGSGVVIDVADIEVELGPPLLELEGAVDAQVELVEVVEALAVARGGVG